MHGRIGLLIAVASLAMLGGCVSPGQVFEDQGIADTSTVTFPLEHASYIASYTVRDWDRYRDDEHFVDGDRNAFEWTLSGTTTEGERLEIHGCDLWTFRDGKVAKKDSYWKFRTEE